MVSFTYLFGIIASTAAMAVATPADIQSRQAGDWTFQYFEGQVHDCTGGPSVTSSTYNGGIGCIQLGLWESVTEAPTGGSILVNSAGGAVTPSLWFDTGCTDPVELVQSNSNPDCYAIVYPYEGGPVSITASQAGA